MTIRDAINQMMTDLELGADPAEVLADHGFEDLPQEAFSSALIHYAEQAPMDVADALAPIVTRVSPIPFGEGDLPSLPEADAILADGGGALDVLSEIGLPEIDDVLDEEVLDSVEADEAVDPDDAIGSVLESVGAADVDDIDDADDTFGEGEEAPDLDQALDVLGEVDEEALDADDLDEAVEALDGLLDDGLNGVDTQDFTDLFDTAAASIDELDDTDPSDLDFE